MGKHTAVQVDVEAAKGLVHALPKDCSPNWQARPVAVEQRRVLGIRLGHEPLRDTPVRVPFRSRVSVRVARQVDVWLAGSTSCPYHE